MNTTVTATGMNVKATSSKALQISTALDGDGKLVSPDITKTATNTGFKTDATHLAGLTPTSTVDGTNWFTATSNSATVSDAVVSTYATATNATPNGDGFVAGNVYYLANTFYLQASAGAGDTLGAITVDSITVSGASSDNKLNPSFRVLVVCGDNKIFCNPTQTTAPTNKGVASLTKTGETVTGATKSDITYATVSGLATGKATLSANNTVVATAVQDTVYTVNVYIYFDGEDATCTTSNAIVLDELTVAVSFTLG